MKYFENLQTTAQRHTMSKRSWENGVCVDLFDTGLKQTFSLEKQKKENAIKQSIIRENVPGYGNKRQVSLFHTRGNCGMDHPRSRGGYRGTVTEVEAVRLRGWCSAAFCSFGISFKSHSEKRSSKTTRFDCIDFLYYFSVSILLIYALIFFFFFFFC